MRIPFTLLARFLIFTYSIALFLASIFMPEPPFIVVLIYLVFIPGYAIVDAASLVKSNIEKIPASIGLSLALLLGVSGVLQVARVTPMFSAVEIISFLTSLFAAKLLLT